MNAPLAAFSIFPGRPRENINGLVFWVPFMNGVTDLSSGLNGALVAGAYAPGRNVVGPSAVFSGAAQPLTLTPGAAYNNMLGTTHSIWVNFAYPNSYNAIFTRGTSNVFNFYVRSSGFLSLFPTGGPSYDNNGNISVPANVWSHLAVSASPAGYATYINAKLDVANTYGGYITDKGTTQGIGWDVGAGGRNFVGSMADVRVYNRAMSAGEIAVLYRQGFAFPLGQGEIELPVVYAPPTAGASALMVGM